jgi:hypothetical protein
MHPEIELQGPRIVFSRSIDERDETVGRAEQSRRFALFLAPTRTVITRPIGAIIDKGLVRRSSLAGIFRHRAGRAADAPHQVRPRGGRVPVSGSVQPGMHAVRSDRCAALPRREIAGPKRRRRTILSTVPKPRMPSGDKISGGPCFGARPARGPRGSGVLRRRRWRTAPRRRSRCSGSSCPRCG